MYQMAKPTAVYARLLGVDSRDLMIAITTVLLKRSCSNIPDTVGVGTERD